jgi:acetyltransferase-like isoleucine patch superfamily enzyme
VRIGNHFHLNLNSTVGHDVVIGDFVTVFPGVNISGNVVIGDKTTIGTGSSILPGVRIGSGCFIGAGAVVTKDVEDGQTVVGVPARPLTKKISD